MCRKIIVSFGVLLFQHNDMIQYLWPNRIFNTDQSNADQLRYNFIFSVPVRLDRNHHIA